MQEATPQQNSQDTVMAQVLQQLQKVQRLQNNVNNIYSITDGLSYDVEQIKKEKEKQQSGEEDQNVIPQKVPSVLTNNERKRYENIGKQFVEGAGKEFDRIKKAISLKDKMKTNNDKFVENVKKAKDTSKKVAKKSSFWKKFLAVIAIIGLVGLLFRDKIAKLLPDFSGGNEGFLKGLKKNMGSLLSNLLDYITNIAGGAVGGVVRYISTNVVPTLVGDFFNITLPRSIVATVLTMLSLFSSGAERQLDQFLKQDMAEHAEKGAEKADAQRKREQFKSSKPADLKLAADEAALNKLSYEKLIEQVQFWEQLVADHEKVWDSDGFMKMLDDQFTSYDLSAQKDAINFAQLHSMIETFKVDGLTEEEVKTIISQVFGGIAPNDISKFQYTSDFANKLLAYSNSVNTRAKVRDARIEALQQAKRKKQQSQRANVDEAKSGEGTPQEIARNNEINLIKKVSINVSDIIVSALGQNMHSLFTSFDNFIGSQGGNHSKIVSVMGSYFTILGQACSQFFITSANLLEGVLKGVYNFYWSKDDGNTPTTKENRAVVSFNVTGNTGNSNIVLVNIDIDDAFSRTYGSLMDSVAKTEKEISDSIQEGNNSLVKIIAGVAVVGSGQRFAERKTEYAKIKEEITAITLDVDKNTKSIGNHEDRLNTIQGKDKQSSPSTSSAPALTLGEQNK